jgi:hypothetical protein
MLLPLHLLLLLAGGPYSPVAHSTLFSLSGVVALALALAFAFAFDFRKASTLFG